MLQIKNVTVKTGKGHFCGESIRFDFMGENWRDFHLMQDIARKYLATEFCADSLFGFKTTKENQLVKTMVFDYPKNKPLSLTCCLESDGKTISFNMTEWKETWPDKDLKVEYKAMNE